MSATPSTESAEFMTTNRIAKIYENLIAECYESEYDTTERAPNTFFPDWDIKWSKNGIVTTSEVKADLRAMETGNLAIEYESAKFPLSCGGSGISSTKADIWIHIIHNYDPSATEIDFIMIPTSELRKIIARNYFRKVPGGNYGSSSMYLVPSSFSELDDYRYTIDLTTVEEASVKAVRSIPHIAVKTIVRGVTSYSGKRR